jgi:serine O-acetyltransferase
VKTVKRLRAHAREMRRLVGLDMRLYAAFPLQYHLIKPERSGWSLFFYLLFHIHTFPSVCLYRVQRFLYDSGFVRLATTVSRLNHLLYGVTIGHEVRSYGALLIAHGHVVLDGYTRLGHEVIINPFVTLGISNSDERPFELWGPVIGNHVNIGTGAKIVGKVNIGDGVKIGANAVVVHDVPAYHTAVGVPARSFPSTGDHPDRPREDEPPR